MNVWHARVDGAGAALPGGGLSSALDSIRQFYADLDHAGGAGHPFFAPGVRFELGNVVDVQTQEIAPVTIDPVVPITGGGALPHAVQIVVGWRTTLAGRRGQGRTFLGPLGTDCKANNGSILPEWRTALLGAAHALVQRNKSDNGWAVGVYGLQTPAKLGGKARVLRDYTGATVNTEFSTLRSRRD